MTPHERVAQALASAAPWPAALDVATQLRDEGMVQPELGALYDEFRVRYSFDIEDLRYEAVLDALDYIFGWCAGEPLYPPRDPVSDSR